MCPEPDMLVEARFLRQLVGVTQLRFVAAQLALSYTREDGTLGVMLFGRRAAQSQRRD
jgi:heat shock protein HslJ